MVYKRGRVWWYKFVWKSEPIRESTKQSNKHVAEQMEAAHKTSLAKGEVGIRDRKPAPTLRQFAVFKEKRKTLAYYEYGVTKLLTYSVLAGTRMDAITTQMISGYIASRQKKGKLKSGKPGEPAKPLQVTTINRELQVLRRMLALASEWGKVEKAPPRVRMIPGERHRERVLRADEEARYFQAAAELGQSLEAAYQAALEGTRAKRGQRPRKPDAYLLRDVAAVLPDCGLRPEECFRLRWDQVRDGGIEMANGKTDSARRRVPLTERVTRFLGMRQGSFDARGCSRRGLGADTLSLQGSRSSTERPVPPPRSRRLSCTPFVIPA